MLTMEEIREKSIPVAKRHKVHSLGVFGSYARGEAGENSDIDFIVSLGELKGGFAYMGFIDDLQSQFELPIDVITDQVDDPVILREALSDRKLVYEG